jgi:hypothetical protein
MKNALLATLCEAGVLSRRHTLRGARSADFGCLDSRSSGVPCSSPFEQPLFHPVDCRQGRLDGEKHGKRQSNGLENLSHYHNEIWSLMPSVGDVRHIACVRNRCIVYSSQMGRLSKSVFLVALLLLAGVPGYASHFCAMPSESHTHDCCMGQVQQAASFSGTTSTASWDSSCCCKVAPLGTVTTTSISTSDRSDDVMYAHLAMSVVALEPPASAIRSNRGSPHLVKLRHSSVHALLCTFLV